MTDLQQDIASHLEALLLLGDVKYETSTYFLIFKHVLDMFRTATFIYVLLNTLGLIIVKWIAVCIVGSLIDFK
jgi:hypothetical protein